MKNKLFVFTKVGVARVIASSLMLALYLIVIIVNFASDNMSGGNLAWTLFFVLGVAGFVWFAQTKTHTPLVKVSRVWMIITLVVCFLGAVLSLVQIEFEGAIGAAVGFFVMVFISPYYGFGFIINKSIAVCIFGCVCSGSLLFLPNIIERVKRRRALEKKYR